MRTSTNIFVKRNKAASHERTVVHVDWDRVSDEDIKMLAERYVVHQLEHELKQREERLPSSIEVLALDYVNNDRFVAKPINLPKRQDICKSKAEKNFEEMFAALSVEEIAILKGEFA